MMDQEREPTTIVIYGASGDLTHRKLIPALFSLYQEGLMPAEFQIIGIARSDMTDVSFREHLYTGVAEFCRIKPADGDLWPGFASRLSYLRGNYDDPETCRRLEERLTTLSETSPAAQNRLFYLAIPPTLYPVVIEQLGLGDLNRTTGGWSRVIVEKPFGRDLETAHELNALIHTYFGEDQVYRIDHYLGKETVQNIMTFRFANSIFEPLWNRNFVDHVRISVLEEVGVGHRGGYYDRAGVVRDMFQNHLLQLLSLTAMEPPIAVNAKALRDEKVKILQAVPPIPLENGVWGQYRGYRQNRGVDPSSNTPTFLSLKLYVNNWRWQGVPFYLRSGKNLSEKATEITLQFKDVPHQLFQDGGELNPNILTLCIQPDEGMHLRFETKVPGAGMRTDPVQMDFHYSGRYGDKALPDAYERLLLDAMQGDASLFARSDEIETAWSLIDPLMKGWESTENPPLAFYEPGTSGPQEAQVYLEREGRVWHLSCGEH